MNKRIMILRSVDARYFKHKIKFRVRFVVVFAIISSGCSLLSEIYRELCSPAQSMGPRLMCWIQRLMNYYIFLLGILVIFVLLPAFELITLWIESKSYSFTKVKLSEYHTMDKQIYFTVTFVDDLGRKCNGKTLPIYQIDSVESDFVKWHEKDVLIAYKTLEERVIVIGGIVE